MSGLLGGVPLVLFASECDSPVAQAVSVQGQVEVAAVKSDAWSSVRQNQWLCPGDRLRVGANSRAGLVLNDNTLLRLAENSSVLISAPESNGRSRLDLLEGIAHFISRVSHSFQVNTPYVSAFIEGTEFTVMASPEGGDVVVMEGRMRAANLHGEVILKGGEHALARPGEAPQLEAVVDPLDAVRWALFYPPLSPPVIDNPSAALQKAYKAYSRGDITTAFAVLDQASEVDERAELLTFRASLHLQVGGLGAAQRDLDSALKLEPGQPDGLALKSVIAVVGNRPQQALELAQQAVAADSDSATPLLALSYARQALFQLTQAMEAATQATLVEPGNAQAWSRLSELQLMFRLTSRATESASKAACLAPELAQTQATLGYAELIRLRLNAARRAFERAAHLDQAAPLPRLGLGLVEIRQGNLAQGRRQIETAANLDPGNALVRSYLGKAYYEEKREGRAATQFALAKQFDDLDPTAWFYDAILKQSENRPVEALGDIRSAIERNDNRVVYRSRLLLDEDRAARNASLANIYSDLGFERLALTESCNSLAADPGNASAHRFLSEAYSGVSRHEIARVSELLRAQMLSPEMVNPVSPSASEVELLTFQGAGPALAGLNEYNPLFNRQRLSFRASGYAGSNNSRGEEITVGGFTNRGMLSAGYYSERSDGFRVNNDSDQSIRNLFGQFRLTTSLSMQGEVKHRENEHGYLAQLYEEDYFLTQVTRRETEADSYRFGLNYTPNQNHTVLLSAVKYDLNTKDIVLSNLSDTDLDAKQYELQYIFNDDNFSVTAGAGQLDLHTDTVRTLTYIGQPPLQLPPASSEHDQQTAYLYMNNAWSWGRTVIGADYAKLDQEGDYSESQINPKLGLIWDISPVTALRLAAFKTIHSRIANNWTIAPTELVGFNQIYDDFNGSKAKRYAIALDHRFADNLDAGVEFSRRVITPYSDFFSALDDEQQELSHNSYLYWIINNSLALGGLYTYEKYHRTYIDGLSDPFRPATLNTGVFKLSATYFHGSGFYAELAASDVAQKVVSILSTTGTLEEKDSFWISDAVLGYRFPKQRGLVKLQIKNLFDNEFRYQSAYPGVGTQIYSPYNSERSLYLYVKIWI